MFGRFGTSLLGSTEFLLRIIKKLVEVILLKSNLLTEVALESNILVQVLLKSNLLTEVALESNVLVQVVLESNLPTEVDLESNIF